MRTNFRPASGERRTRAPGRWTRLLTSTALATAAVITVTSGQFSNLRPTAPVADQAGDFDAEKAEQIRTEQCRLNFVLRKGGAEMKAVARAGLAGTEEQLHTAAAENYWDGTPLSAAYDKDHAASNAKQQELYPGRQDAWEVPLRVAQPSYAPGFSASPPGNPGDDQGTIFWQTGFASWISDQFWTSESDFYEDMTPSASKESVDAVTKIATTRYSEDRYEDYKDWDAWRWQMQYMHPMYADDARLFLQYGGFPTTAPDPDSMEFRIDVENLKARFASCHAANPIDPHNVLTAEVTAASTEWQAELSGQAAQRDTILAAEAQANKDLQVAAQAMGEALGQSMIAERLTVWQAYWTKEKPEDHDLEYPEAAVFTNVSKAIADARGRAAGRLFVASRAARSAQDQAAKVTTAQNAAYAVADTAGQPRGRGLMYAQQAAQITKASAAAAQAAAKATETAYNASRASVADSKTLNALAMTQAHASKAEFRRKAAEEAAAQAKAAAEGAAAQAVQAAQNASRAKAAQEQAAAAEKTAKSAADDAAAKRDKAEAEAAYAKSQKELADAERAKAASAESKARSQRQVAADQLAAAQAAGSTAAAKKDEALEAERKAVRARDNALQAESDRDALTAKAEALEAKADADEGTDAAIASRAAATDARTAADSATSAATSARAAANDATDAATNARAAATRADAAAKRAQAAADAAQRDVTITAAAEKKAHAAAAEAIDAAWDAKWNAITAKSQAETARENAAKAKSDAAVARTEAIAAGADAISAAGHAYATAQAALAARDSAAQVIKPANDAIELGSPYAETDSSAGLAVLTGQASKTAAEQQAALAKAKAAQAAKAAADAKALAAKASADAKAAADAAAAAAESSASATKSAADAQASANAADASSNAAQKSEANTVAYHKQAVADADAAQSAANSAGDYASQADASATDAERDASSARGAADAAEADASTARGVADKAEADATTAEASAARAQDAAKEAQDAAERAENAQAREVITTGGATGIGRMFTRQKIDPIGDPEPQNDCVLGMGNSGCDVKFKLRYNVTVDFYLCGDADAEADVSASTCPTAYVTWLGSETYKDQTTYVTKHFSNWDITKIVDKAILEGIWDMLTQDFIDCWRQITPGNDGGSVSGCAWAAATFIPGEKILAAAKYALLVEDAVKTGVGAEKLLGDLKKVFGEKPSAAKLADPDSVAGMALRLSERMSDRTMAANGLDLDLVRKLEASGANFNRAGLVMVVRYPRPGVPVAWLEKGNVKAGLVHIIFRHAGEFIEKGVASEDIPKLLNKALTEGKIVGYQGADAGRPIYETVFNGRTHRVAITVGDNGFIVGANPA